MDNFFRNRHFTYCSSDEDILDLTESKKIGLYFIDQKENYCKMLFIHSELLLCTKKMGDINSAKKIRKLISAISELVEKEIEKERSNKEFFEQEMPEFDEEIPFQ